MAKVVLTNQRTCGQIMHAFRVYGPPWTVTSRQVV